MLSISQSRQQLTDYMDTHSQIQIVERYNSVTLCQEPDFLFWQQSPAGGADLDSAEAFANRLLALIGERRQLYGVGLRNESEANH